MSNYRIYKTEDLEKLVTDIEAGSIPTKAKPRTGVTRKKVLARKLIVRSERE